jgi:FAD/FMN-containing dehydrogenase
MNPQVISKLKANLRGRVILPEDQDYNQARKVYNGMIDRHPKTIVKFANAGDVRLAVEFARENELLVAVRGGGHNGAGLGTCEWADSAIDAVYDDVWRMLMDGLCVAKSPGQSSKQRRRQTP